MSQDGDARPGVERVFDQVRWADRGITAATIARRVGLHVTTVRFHLDSLAAQGRVVGHAAPTGARGRPSVAFRAVPVDDARAEMLAALASAAAEQGAVAERARRAGEAWARSLDLDDQPAPTALAEVFARLGFAPEAFEGGLGAARVPLPRRCAAAPRGGLRGASRPRGGHRSARRD